MCNHSYTYTLLILILFVLGLLYNGNYYFLTSLSTFAVATTTCASSGGYLATISSDDLNAALASRFGGSSALWIGYARTVLPCGETWAWQDGSTSTYTHWNGGEPNCASIYESCATFDPYLSFLWNDFNCEGALPGICSIKGTYNHFVSHIVSFTRVLTTFLLIKSILII